MTAVAAFYVSATPVTGLVVHHSGGLNLHWEMC